MPPSSLSSECIDQLHAWVMAHCPCALEESDFLPGFIVIIEEEISRALRAERHFLLQKLSEPSPQ